MCDEEASAWCQVERVILGSYVFSYWRDGCCEATLKDAEGGTRVEKSAILFGYHDFQCCL